MYQSHNPADNPLVYNPEATIVIADRACDTYSTEYGKPTEVNAEYVSQAIRDRWVRTNAYDRVQSDIQKIADFVRNTAGETDNEEVIEVLTELADILGINLTKTYTVSLTFSVEATIELPIGRDSDEIDADDFDLSLEYNNYGAEMPDWGLTDRTIDYIQAFN